MTVQSGHSCPECGSGQSEATAAKEVATDGSSGKAGAGAPPSDDGYLPTDVWVTIAAVGTALVAGYVGYAIINLQWESLLPFPVITVLTFAFLVRKESPRRAVGTGLYIIAGLLFLWVTHYIVRYLDVFVAHAGPNLLFAVGAAIVVWMVLLAVTTAVLGVHLNRTEEK
ncbi:hypothetical protein [Natrinema ejinorense]|uniref:hypothetical protein n=1 Tax=Natrinema ejinorense TaxID=373386 RepID=UPI00117FD2DC|nr:hypothetical protein [Natrinema ejinorense]